MLPSSAGDASQLAGTSEQLLQDIHAFGRVPKSIRGSSELQVRERNLEKRLRKAREAGHLSAAQEAELADLGDAIQLAGTSKQPSEQLLQDIRAFGRVPKSIRGSSELQVRERNLEKRLRKAREAGHLSAAQEAELADLGDAIQLAGTSKQPSEQLLQRADAKEDGSPRRRPRG